MVVTLYCWNQPDKVVEAANRAEIQQQGNSSLNTFILNPLVLKSNKAQLAKNNLLKGALTVLLSQANKAMQVPLYSVMDKAKVLSSLPMIQVRNIHDYYSIAPYWWPSSKPNVFDKREDGNTNPITKHTRE